ncbi:uncharacterized protein LOC122504790 [Leptopilina heterotoma]|uniref:uncharacterized protein LOC122504790 n=1 Tax=Leptopilina heterotoma TaxID=63436 RepID=UPI001CA7CB15|nr:uncharacterized protein LOC122504790 [Leptopilina heterotoma]
MPKCKSSKKSRRRIDLKYYNEVCEEADSFIKVAERELSTTMNMTGDDKLIKCFEWQNKCERYKNIMRNFLKKYEFLPYQKSRCLNLNQKIEYLSCHFDTLMKRGAGVQMENERLKWVNFDKAFDDRLQTSAIMNLSYKDINLFLDDAFALFEINIQKALNRFGPLKVYTVLGAKFVKDLNNGKEEISDLKTFIAKTVEILSTTPLEQWYNENVKQPTLKRIEEFQQKDSNWRLHSIERLEVNINKYNPMRASSYINLPSAINRKHACINVQNADNQCFKWSILSALYPSDNKHAHRVAKYRQYEDLLDFTGIEFPVALKDISKFEALNNISVNVYGLVKRDEKFTVSPLHLSSQKKIHHVNLLRVEDHYIDENHEEEEEEDEIAIMSFNYHYVWIKDLSRLVSSELSKKKRKKYICDRCLHYFGEEYKLNEHEENCRVMNDTRIKLPQLGKNILEFQHFQNKERVPFIIYADCESLLIPTEAPKEISNTEVFQNHETLSIGYYLKCAFDDSLSVYKSSPRDEEYPAKWFSKELKNLADNIDSLFKNPVPMETLSSQQWVAFRNDSTCHICKKKIEPGQVKVRDHCHLTGKFRGPAHQECNINYHESQTIPVVFHNLSGYDAHFIIESIATEFEGNVYLLPINKEKYISFTKNVKGSFIKFRFIDSFKFMASSLDKLASYLNEYKIVNSVFSNYSDDKIHLLTRKGVFSYEYIDSREKLNETELPPKEKFYSTLNDSNVSDDDYTHAQKVWNEFNCQNLGDYVYLYMQTDILLLADIFENFRNQCLVAYGLDAAHYYTTPGLTWDAMLKYTEIRLELLTDIDMVMFIERGIRGGVSQCMNRYAKANNHYMKNYNESEETSYIMYFDANNLYGWAMVQSLPYGGFKWVENVDNSFDFNVADDAPTGYILEVDLDYPDHLHDKHSDFPFCPERSKPPGSKEEKLLTTLLPKRKHVLHYCALKQAIANGLVLVKIHRVLKFEQSMWLKSYIDFNTTKRTNASNEFEKNLFKLMNNAVFGKTMENVRKHVDIKLVTKWEGRYGAEALISKPNFHSRAIFNENLVAVELRKMEVLMNKPLYIGLTVLDVSKTLIYDFHYDYMLKKYDEKKLKLLYTDTDSLIYEIKCCNIYEDMKKDIQKFDTSDYPTNNVYNIPQANKKILGLMKDECSGKIVTEFVGLRSKMYSVRVEEKDLIKKAKGVKAGVVKKNIDFDDYVYCLRNVKIQSRTQYCIRSKLHNVQTLKQTKIALSPYDDKRYLLANSTDTLAWGHCKIVQYMHDDNDDDEPM